MCEEDMLCEEGTGISFLIEEKRTWLLSQINANSSFICASEEGYPHYKVQLLTSLFTIPIRLRSKEVTTYRKNKRRKP